MPVIRLTSDKFPSISIPVTHMPGTEQPGSFEFYMGMEYTVTPATLQDIRRNLQGFPPRVRDYILLSVREEEPPPPPPPAPPEPTLSASSDTLLEDLSDEDLDWVTVEVGKLRGLTISEAVPLVEAVAANEQVSLAARIAYLTKVSETATVQLAVRRKATELLQQLPKD